MKIPWIVAPRVNTNGIIERVIGTYVDARQVAAVEEATDESSVLVLANGTRYHTSGTAHEWTLIIAEALDGDLDDTGEALLAALFATRQELLNQGELIGWPPDDEDSSIGAIRAAVDQANRAIDRVQTGA